MLLLLCCMCFSIVIVVFAVGVGLCRANQCPLLNNVPHATFCTGDLQFQLVFSEGFDVGDLFETQTFEVDVFSGDNTGLIVAEIELTHEQEVVGKPHWLGKEVTNDSKYYNAALSKNPFMVWEQEQQPE